MEINLSDLVVGSKITISPAVDNGELYFHAIFENVPYFVLSDYHSLINWDEDTLIAITNIDLINNKKIVKEFRNYVYSCIPEYEGWQEAKIDFNSVRCDSKNILRISFRMLWCEVKNKNIEL